MPRLELWNPTLNRTERDLGWGTRPRLPDAHLPHPEASDGASKAAGGVKRLPLDLLVAILRGRPDHLRSLRLAPLKSDHRGEKGHFGSRTWGTRPSHFK